MKIQKESLQKTLHLLLTILMLTLLPLGAQAASGRCTVIRSEGSVLIMECRRENPEFRPGTKVKIKTDRKAPREG